MEIFNKTVSFGSTVADKDKNVMAIMGVYDNWEEMYGTLYGKKPKTELKPQILKYRQTISTSALESNIWKELLDGLSKCRINMVSDVWDFVKSDKHLFDFTQKFSNERVNQKEITAPNIAIVYLTIYQSDYKRFASILPIKLTPIDVRRIESYKNDHPKIESRAVATILSYMTDYSLCN